MISILVINILLITSIDIIAGNGRVIKAYIFIILFIMYHIATYNVGCLKRKKKMSCKGTALVPKGYYWPVP